MTWHQGRGGSGSGGSGGTSSTAIQAFRARFANVAEWWPDLTQRGFPAALFRFLTTETLVAPVGTTFANSIQHRAFVRTNVTATTAAVVREATAGGADGPASCSTLAGFEILAVVRFDTVELGQWGIIGAFLSAGSFPFPDLWTRDHVAGIGFTSVATATPITDLELITRDGSSITRTPLVSSRAVGSWLAISLRVYAAHETGGARVVGRVLNIATGVEVTATHTTTLPVGLLHGAVLHNVGAAPVGSAGISIAYIGRGTL